jgi:hypothetical protein
MTKSKKPPDKPPEDSLAKLAVFTKRILQVTRAEIQSNGVSNGTKKIDEACRDT